MGAIIFWFVFANIGMWYFFIDRNAARKRRLWPIVVILVNGSFIGIVLGLGLRGTGLALMIPAILLISAAQIYKVRFCDNCGATVGLLTRGILPPASCNKCATDLN